MYKQRNKPTIVTFQNEECNCFGTNSAPQEQFLAKQNIFEVAPNPHTHPSKDINPDASFFKNSFKKSLKRQFVPVLCPTPNSPSSNQKHNHPKLLNPSEKHRDVREFLSPQCKPVHDNFRTPIIPSGFMSPTNAVTVQHREFINCKSVQQPSSQFNTKIPLLSPPNASFRSPSKPVTISYYPTTSFTSPQKRCFPPVSSPSFQNYSSPSKIDFSPINLSHKNSQQKEEMEDSQSTKIISKIQLNETVQKVETSSSLLRSPTFKSAVCHTNSNFESQRQEAGKLSIVASKAKSQEETVYSYLEVNSLKENRQTLKRMSEVQEIHSQPDSDQISDSEKESVVLGRLNEYGSMIDPAISHVSSASSGILMRFNSGVELGRLMDGPFLAY